MDHRVHVLASTQDLHNSKRNFVKIAGDYLGEEILLCLLMGTWLRHIERFEQQYNKDFAKDPLFGEELINRIHKRVQVFLHYCNTNSIEEVELGALA